MVSVTDRGVTVERTNTFFKVSELAGISAQRVPRHVAIIPDGNRRWAADHATTSHDGHRHGADVVLDIVQAAKELAIEVVTIYTFSTENWRRPPADIDALFLLLDGYLKNQCLTMQRNGVRLHTIGDLTQLPERLQTTVEETRQATEHCTDIDFVLALNYGGRDDIRRACTAIAKKVAAEELSAEAITEETIANHLDTLPWGDPDLLIRAGGELRISNFLIWQLSYSEIYSCDVFWPDFTPHHLLDAVKEFQRRNRRVGS